MLKISTKSVPRSAYWPFQEFLAWVGRDDKTIPDTSRLWKSCKSNRKELKLDLFHVLWLSQELYKGSDLYGPWCWRNWVPVQQWVTVNCSHIIPLVEESSLFSPTHPQWQLCHSEKPGHKVLWQANAYIIFCFLEALVAQLFSQSISSALKSYSGYPYTLFLFVFCLFVWLGFSYLFFVLVWVWFLFYFQ